MTTDLRAKYGNAGILGYVQGIWVFLVCAAIQWFTLVEPLPERLANLLGSPSSDAQKYLALHVAKGISAGLGLVIIGLFLAFTWRRSPKWAQAGAVCAWGLSTPAIGDAFYILWRCLKSIEAAPADAILSDVYRPSFQQASFYTGLYSVLILFMGAALVRWFVSKRRSLRDAGRGDAAAT